MNGFLFANISYSKIFSCTIVLNLYCCAPNGFVVYVISDVHTMLLSTYCYYCVCTGGDDQS